MAKQFRPMKPVDPKDSSLDGLPLPMIVMPKYDGIRFVTVEKDGKVCLLTYSLKPLRNSYCQKLANLYMEPGLDGELMLFYSDGDYAPFENISSFYMSEAKDNTFLDKNHLKMEWVVFDSFLDPTAPYTERLKYAQSLVCDYPRGTDKLNIGVSVNMQANSLDEVFHFHQTFLNKGMEGSVLRRPDGHYKFGRSTMKEAYGVKLKPFQDTEGTIVEVLPLMKNLSESYLNEKGLKAKHKNKADLIPLPTAGVLILDHPEYGQIRIGSGMDDETRKHIWDNKESLMGSLVKFKHIGLGIHNKPRHPVYLGFRDSDDL